MPGIEIPIGAPLDQLTKDLNQANVQIKKSVLQMEINLKSFQTIAKQSLDPNVIAKYNAKAQELQAQIKQLTNSGKAGFDEFGNAVGKSGNGLTKVFSGLTRLAYVLPGLGIAGIFTLGFEALEGLVKELEVFKTRMTESSALADTLGKAFESSEYVGAVKNVTELRTNIELAKQGLISKDGVLKQYNDTIGKTTGLVNNLDQAETALTKNAPAYIKMMLLKAQAQEALTQAAKAGIEKESLIADEQLSFTDKLKDFAKTAVGTALGIQANPLFNGTILTRLSSAGKAMDRQNTLLNIYNKLSKQAADIAKQNNFNFFEDTKAGKKAKSEKLNPALNAKNFSFNKLSLTPDTSALDKSVNDSISRIGGKTAQDTLRKNLAAMTEALSNYATSAGKILEDLNNNASNIINNNITSTFEALGAAIGDSLAGVGNIFQNLGNALLSSLGSILGQLGQMAIATGVAILGIKTALKTLNPFAAIAAGVALIAISGVVKHAAAGLGNSIGSGSSYTAASPGQGVSPSSSSTGGGSISTDGRVVFEISGVNLVGVLNRAGQKLQRIGG